MKKDSLLLSKVIINYERNFNQEDPLKFENEV